MTASRGTVGRVLLWLGGLMAALAAVHVLVLIARSEQESPPPVGAVYREMGAILGELFTGGGR